MSALQAIIEIYGSNEVRGVLILWGFVACSWLTIATFRAESSSLFFLNKLAFGLALSMGFWAPVYFVGRPEFWFNNHVANTASAMVGFGATGLVWWLDGDRVKSFFRRFTSNG